MTADAEKSFKARLRNIAKETDRNPADLWQSLVLERFLVRLAASPHRSHFVLKGGVLLAKYMPLGRETRDLDFLAVKTSRDVEQVKVVFTEIATIDLGDGFTFQDVDVNELNHPHMAYVGLAVGMMAYYGNVRFRVMIDIGFGDTIRPIDKKFPLTSSLKGPLFEEQVSLLCYPQEFIFAEKLETVVYRAGANSRMKDFHDLYAMIQAPELLSEKMLRDIVPTVFRHRTTRLSLPITFKTHEIDQLQSLWMSYRVGLKAGEAQILPPHIFSLIEALNEWLRLRIGG